MVTEEERLKKHNDDPDFLSLVRAADEMYMRNANKANHVSLKRAIELYQSAFAYIDDVLSLIIANFIAKLVIATMRWTIWTRRE